MLRNIILCAVVFVVVFYAATALNFYMTRGVCQ